MKSVLISIQPKWCELIASGKKTVEVRKTKPKLETPFKCYIYCTKGETIYLPRDIFGKEALNGKVIGEFVCDKITKIIAHGKGYGIIVEHPFTDSFTKDSCLTVEQLDNYLKGNDGYGWHISDLVIYDKPRDLSEFKTICRNAYCQDYWGDPTWFCKDGYSSCAVTDKEREFPYNEECIYFDCPSVGGESCEYEDYAYCNCNGLKPLTRPPQSWCYVESEDKE